MTHGGFSNEKEPAPISTDRIPTWDFVISDYKESISFALHPERSQKILDFMEDRKAYGYGKHNTHLTPENGRDDLSDLVQELADAIVYSRNKILGMSASGFAYHRLWTLHNSLVASLEECFYIDELLSEAE